MKGKYLIADSFRILSKILFTLILGEIEANNEPKTNGKRVETSPKRVGNEPF